MAPIRVSSSLILLSLVLTTIVMLGMDHSAMMMQITAYAEERVEEETADETVADIMKDKIESVVEDVMEVIDDVREQVAGEEEEAVEEEEEAVPEIINESVEEIVDEENSEIEEDESSSEVVDIFAKFANIKTAFVDGNVVEKAKKGVAVGLGIWGAATVTSWITQRGKAVEEVEIKKRRFR